MVRILPFILAGMGGLVIGSVSALFGAGLISGGFTRSFADIDVGGWRSDWAIGSEAANPYLRARIARHGLLAMRKEGAVYFTRATDDDGQPLSGRCRYLLSGQDQDAFWWSITLYDENSMLPLNDGEALSFDASDMTGAAGWQAIVSAERPLDAGGWISSEAADTFDLMLRLYRPSEVLLSDPVTYLNPPSIERLSCEGEE